MLDLSENGLRNIHTACICANAGSSPMRSAGICFVLCLLCMEDAVHVPSHDRVHFLHQCKVIMWYDEQAADLAVKRRDLIEKKIAAELQRAREANAAKNKRGKLLNFWSHVIVITVPADIFKNCALDGGHYPRPSSSSSLLIFSPWAWHLKGSVITCSVIRKTMLLFIWSMSSTTSIRGMWWFGFCWNTVFASKSNKTLSTVNSANRQDSLSCNGRFLASQASIQCNHHVHADEPTIILCIGAILALKKKKLLEGQLVTAENNIQRLTEQQMMLEEQSSSLNQIKVHLDSPSLSTLLICLLLILAIWSRHFSNVF